MVRRAVPGRPVPGDDAVALAVALRAEEGAAADDVLEVVVLDAGFRAVGTARRRFRALRVQLRALLVIVRAEAVRHPLPDVAGHVVEAVAVGGELRDGG